MLSRLIVSVLLFALVAGTAAALNPAEVKLIVSAGGEVTVDTRFGAAVTHELVGLGGNRITVVCSGFPIPDVKKFQANRARLVVDSRMPLEDVTQLCQIGRINTLISPAGFQPAVLQTLTSYGCPLLANEGGASFEEKLKTLQGRGQAVADKRLPVGQVLQLCQAGRERLHVIAGGFKPAEASQFVGAGAIVWVDSSFPVADVLSMIRSGGRRVVCYPSAFTLKSLEDFSRAHAQICFAFDGGAARDAARADAFEKLNGDDKPKKDKKAK